MPALTSSTGSFEALSVRGEQRAQRRQWRRLYLQILAFTLVMGGFAYLRAPHPAALTLAVYALLSAWILARPAAGLYIVIFLTLLGDAVVSPWYPFVKNLSSRESVSYVHDALTITPIELLILVTVVAWLVRMYATHSWSLRRGVLMWPMIAFGSIVAFGLVRAVLGAGDLRIAIFEGRAMLYLPVLYLLIVQLLDSRRQYVQLFIVALAGIVGQSIIALLYFNRLDVGVRTDLESLTEHSASVHLAALFLIALATMVVPGCSARLRWFVLVASVPGVFVFALSQRRSAAVALGVGVLMLFVVLWRIRPRALAWLVPISGLLATAYLAAFWNVSGSTGFAAQAFKSVFAKDQLDAVDRSSNLYREVESFDLWFTIRAAPLRGVGFGNPFYQPWPLPYLEGFEFRDFIPHNTLLWVWLKLGVIGFVAVLYLVARATQHGARSVILVGHGDQAALMIGAVGYVVMYTVFAYVDIAWDARSMVFLALAMAWSADLRARPGDASGPSADPIAEPVASSGSPPTPAE